MAKGKDSNPGTKQDNGRQAIKQQFGRNMRSSNTNHVVASAKAAISKPAKGNHQNAVKKALLTNSLIVVAQNLKI